MDREDCNYDEFYNDLTAHYMEQEPDRSDPPIVTLDPIIARLAARLGDCAKIYDGFPGFVPQGVTTAIVYLYPDEELEHVRFLTLNHSDACCIFDIAERLSKMSVLVR
jgi:hypothetical protein